MNTEFVEYAQKAYREHPGLFEEWTKTEDPIKAAIGRAVLKVAGGDV